MNADADRLPVWKAVKAVREQKRGSGVDRTMYLVGSDWNNHVGE